MVSKHCSYDKWDHRFFGVNDIEADVMDPQQKLVLDCVYMAMEDGGIVSKDLEKTRTGVYIGKFQVIQYTSLSKAFNNKKLERW